MSLKVPILVQPVSVNNDVPIEAEVELAVRGLKGGRAVGPSGMRLEDLKGRLKKSKRDKESEGRRWEMLVQIVQVMFRDGTVPEEILWAKMVLVTKGKGGYMDIGLVEVLCKV